MKFEDFSKKNDPKGIEIDIAGTCDVCFHQIDKTIFNKKDMTLLMICDQGHESIFKTEIDWSFYGNSQE